MSPDPSSKGSFNILAPLTKILGSAVTNKLLTHSEFGSGMAQFGRRDCFDFGV